MAYKEVLRVEIQEVTLRVSLKHRVSIRQRSGSAER